MFFGGRPGDGWRDATRRLGGWCARHKAERRPGFAGSCTSHGWWEALGGRRRGLCRGQTTGEGQRNSDIADQAVPCNNNPSCGCAALLQEVASTSGVKRVEKGKKGERVSPEGADDDVATLSVASLSQSEGDTREEQTGAEKHVPQTLS
ncbi:hypothetical protein HPB47_021694 [Ixodes persulcatus]|uniref:Uncharacterized protein n=1 Tax=Ixodes persulcatus TaxID=34615 RepID=A0AC60QCU4_IXOPE|nr:hypothetical protein HPB47_021694 [Ixodes persulcatus]